MSSGRSCFPAPLPVAPFFLMSPPLSRSWRQGRAGRWPLLPGSSGFDSLSWGKAWAFLPAEPWAGTELGMGPKTPAQTPTPGQGQAGQGPWLKQLLGHWQQVMSEYHLPLLCCRSVTPESLTEQEPEVPPAGNWDLDPKLLRLSSASLFSKQNLLSVSKFPFQFFLENPAANGFKCSVCV